MRTRPPVRLKREVLWKRLEALNRSQAWLAREAGITPGYLSPKAPFGYKRVKVRDGMRERPTLEVDPAAAPLVREIFGSSLRGNGLKEICRDLNERGITKNGKRWQKNGLYYLLTNEAYTGTAVWGRTTKGEKAPDPVRVEGAWEALVSKELFDKVQQVLRERAPAKQRPARVGSKFLLSGLLRCGLCGKPYTGQGAKSGRFGYYVCGTLLREGAGTCEARYLNADRVEEFIVGKIRERILTDETITELVTLVAEEVDAMAGELVDRLKAIEAELADVDGRLRRLYEALEKSDLTLEALSPRILELRHRQDQLAAAREEAAAHLSQRRVELPTTEEIKGYVADFRSFLCEGTVPERKALIRNFVKGIEVTGEEARLIYSIPMPSDGVTSEETPVLDFVQSGLPPPACPFRCCGPLGTQCPGMPARSVGLHGAAIIQPPGRWVPRQVGTSVRRVILAGVALAITFALLSLSTNAQPERTTLVEVRVWQLVADPADLAISIRPEGASWADLGTIALDMRGLSDTRLYRYADTTTGGVQIRVWQRFANLSHLYISARPTGGSWADLGTIALDMRGLSDSGLYRYGHIALRVASQPRPEGPETGDPVDEFAAVLALSVGGAHTCALWESGALACWGENQYGQTDVPRGRYRSVSVGLDYTCAVRHTGRLFCWGNDSRKVIEDYPEGLYRSVSSSTWHGCAVRESGEVDCWGRNEGGQTEAPEGMFRSVSAGSQHTCGLRHSGGVECWGGNEDGRTDTPDGAFRSVSAGGYHSCAVRESGRIECWGSRAGHWTNPPAGRFSSVSVSTYHSCALGELGEVRCWGPNSLGRTAPPPGAFRLVEVGAGHSCGVLQPGGITCWGGQILHYGKTSPPAGVYRSVSAGDDHSCALGESGRVTCWGDDRHGQLDAPDRTYQSVSAGFDHSCGLRATGEIDCWGVRSSADYGQAAPPEGQFQMVSAGHSDTCGVTELGAVECWGRWLTGEERQPSGGGPSPPERPPGDYGPPSGSFRVVDVGRGFGCAIGESGAVACWGDRSSQLLTGPAGRYEAVSASEVFACALHHSGGVDCWGDTRYDLPTSPEGTYRSVTVGSRHGCALRVSGEVHCWGSNT